MAVTDAQRRAKQKYRARGGEKRIVLDLPAKDHDEIAEHCALTGEAYATFIRRAIKTQMARDLEKSQQGGD